MRNQGIPRYAFTQILLTDLPMKLATLFQPEPMLRFLILQAPMYLTGLWVLLNNLNATLTTAYISEAQSTHSATHDKLTGVLNRLGILNLMTASLNSKTHGDSDFCVLCLDLDWFKKINDANGHATGDRVLVSFSEMAQSSTDYVLNFIHAFDEQKSLQLFVSGTWVGDQCDGASIVWPTINGQAHGAVSPAGDDAPDGPTCWFVTSYPYTELSDTAPGSLELVWEDLDIATRQTALSKWWIVRNANLAGADGAQTNQALVYQTPHVSFASPVVPIITMPSATFDSGPSLVGAIVSALTPLAEATRAAAKDRLLKITITHSYQVAAAPEGKTGLWSDLPILLANDLQLTTEAADGLSEGSITLEVLAIKLADDCARWFDIVQPCTANALLRFDVTLFANVDGTQVPIVFAPSLDIQVPNGWWPKP